VRKFYEQIPDGILLLKARTSGKSMQEPGWNQDPSFFYFTGLDHQPAAILALDGVAMETHLFVPPDPRSFGVPVEGLSLRPLPSEATRLGYSTVQDWEFFQGFIRSRLSDGVDTIYLETPRRPEGVGVPSDMLAVSGDMTLWHQSLRTAFPIAVFKQATDAIRLMRWNKSEAEVAILRHNAALTASALLEGIKRIRPGAMQREAEAGFVSGCLDNGGEGPSFWPWMMSGPNTGIHNLVRSFFDYSSMNRKMIDGELVRVDTGCGSRGYGGDVGRTIPVSGTFSKEQAGVWDLLITGYLAGIKKMQSGISRDEVREESRKAILEYTRHHAKEGLDDIARAMITGENAVNWHIHGVGIESGEEAVDVFAHRTVIAYEPMFSWQGQTSYLEDMILVSEDGAEVLSANLPYWSADISALMHKRKHP